MCTPTRRYDLHAFTHLLNGHAIELGGPLDKRLDERDAFFNIVGFETLEVERAAREVLQGRLAKDSFVQEPFVMEACETPDAVAEARMVVVPVVAATSVSIGHVQDEGCESASYTLGVVLFSG